jgi:hypothetical protein
MFSARKDLPNFKELNKTDGVIYGAHNKVISVNPYFTFFKAGYPDGKIIEGKNLFRTGWDDIPNGLNKLSYVLSTGHVIEIPKYKAYKPMIEVSFAIDGSRVFHFVNVNCLAEREILIYRIVLRQDNIKPQKIGDIIMGKKQIPSELDSSWKFTS